jgi:hypothetical protein
MYFIDHRLASSEWSMIEKRRGGEDSPLQVPSPSFVSASVPCKTQQGTLGPSRETSPLSSSFTSRALSLYLVLPCLITADRVPGIGALIMAHLDPVRMYSACKTCALKPRKTERSQITNPLPMPRMTTRDSTRILCSSTL